VVNASTRSGRRLKPIQVFLFLLLGLSVSAVSLWLIARTIDPERFAQRLLSIDYGWLLIAVLAIEATFFTRTRRWAVLLRPQAVRSTALLLAMLTGQLLNLLLPIRIGDVARAVLVGRQPGGSFARAFGSILIEKAWDWLMLCLVVIVVALFAPLPAWFLVPARTIGLIALGILIGFGVIAALPQRMIARTRLRLDRGLDRAPGRWQEVLRRNLHRLLDSLTALRRRELIAGAAGWSILTWGLGIAANDAVLRAYGVESWLAAMALIAVLMIGVALPPSIAAVGIWEGLTMLTLGAFGVAPETGLAIGIISHAIILATLLINTGMLGLYEVGYRNRTSASETDK
jgi:glycosyltransferase 2 family protein